MKSQQNEEESWSKFFLETIIMIAAILGTFYLLITFVISNDRVSGISMQPTFENNERLISFRNFKPKRNDIVVLHPPKNAQDNSKDFYIKRIIGLPGDKIVSKNDKMYVNGKLLSEPYLENHYKKVDNDAGHTYTTNFSYKVPKDAYWVMGDHRDVSRDSRFFGPVKRDSIIGKAAVRYWPLNKIQTF
ncbi:signal peptidase I [Lactobacillus sp. ESL0681]|uniref:signal peptidase I n=1 Tax=Lactobacillus sp. ESL0681 TaxID=2983211 RepID=UPI0023F8AC8A|nr:signal peptidase I [Lactobacillus sp. ESL0681]WEV40515.1 signal peptidase I [Lactobacillus sp. ESL0681]